MTAASHPAPRTDATRTYAPRTDAPRTSCPPRAVPAVPVPRPAARSVPRLGARTRRAVLIVHLASMGTWLGMDVVLGILVASALFTAPQDAAVLAVAIGAFVGPPLVAAAVVTLLSGIVLGLGSKYGLVRYPWVSVKLVLTLVLTVLVVLVLVPSVAELSAQAQQALQARSASSADGATSFVFDRQLIYPPIVSTAALLFAAGLSVIKPWGPRGIRRARRRGDRAAGTAR